MVDQKTLFGYNIRMNPKFVEILQWCGAVFIVAGHSLNALGPDFYPYNVLTFFLGTVLFLAWSMCVGNRPQTFVNLVAITIGLFGLAQAFG